MAGEQQPINITRIHGCGLYPEMPKLKREDSEVICTQCRATERMGLLAIYVNVELDEVDESAGIASCIYAQCFDQLGPMI
jgi:hypothetical protein